MFAAGGSMTKSKLKTKLVSSSRGVSNLFDFFQIISHFIIVPLPRLYGLATWGSLLWCGGKRALGACRGGLHNIMLIQGGLQRGF